MHDLSACSPSVCIHERIKCPRVDWKGSQSLVVICIELADHKLVFLPSSSQLTGQTDSGSSRRNVTKFESYTPRRQHKCSSLEPWFLLSISQKLAVYQFLQALAVSLEYWHGWISGRSDEGQSIAAGDFLIQCLCVLNQLWHYMHTFCYLTKKILSFQDHRRCWIRFLLGTRKFASSSIPVALAGGILLQRQQCTKGQVSEGKDSCSPWGAFGLFI